MQEVLSKETATDGKAAQPVDMSTVSEEAVTQALDHLEKELERYLDRSWVQRAGEHRIVNVLSKSLGVIARNEQSLDVVCYLLPRNSEVPLERMTDFGTDADNQAAVDIRVMSGERDSPDPLDCQEVGVASLNLPDRLPARSPIRVKFAISKDGRLGVSATDLTGGGSIDVEFQTEAVMNAEEVAGSLDGLGG